MFEKIDATINNICVAVQQQEVVDNPIQFYSACTHFQAAALVTAVLISAVAFSTGTFLPIAVGLAALYATYESVRFLENVKQIAMEQAGNASLDTLEPMTEETNRDEFFHKVTQKSSSGTIFIAMFVRNYIESLYATEEESGEDVAAEIPLQSENVVFESHTPPASEISSESIVQNVNSGTT